MASRLDGSTLPLSEQNSGFWTNVGVLVELDWMIVEVWKQAGTCMDCPQWVDIRTLVNIFCGHLGHEAARSFITLYERCG